MSSIDRVHPSLREFTRELSKTQPCVVLSAANIRILYEPPEFHSHLLGMISRAKRRIFLSSLYIGGHDIRLLHALSDALRLNPELHVHMHLDYNRSTRPEPASSAQLLLPIISSYPDRVHVYLFKSPKLKGLLGRLVPRRFDEGWGTWHAKMYGVDDEVIISGANLNESYFTNRQDRYLCFQSSALAQYCFNFLRTVENSCYRLKERTDREHNSQDSSYALIWPDDSRNPENIEHSTGIALQKFQETQRLIEIDAKEDATDADDVLIFPIIQAGQFGIREEERSLHLLFNHLSQELEATGQKPILDLTSGYFSLYESYQKLVRQSTIDCRIVAASPMANGFFGSPGISGRIPEGYTYLEQRFWRGIMSSSREWRGTHGVQLHEWNRKDWTYHAKGIWFSATPSDPPILTLFGSTNLNSRSANLDTELSFLMVVPDSAKTQDLRKRLADEVTGLRRFAIPWKGDQRIVRPGTKLLVGLVGSML